MRHKREDDNRPKTFTAASNVNTRERTVDRVPSHHAGNRVYHDTTCKGQGDGNHSTHTKHREEGERTWEAPNTQQTTTNHDNQEKVERRQETSCVMIRPIPWVALATAGFFKKEVVQKTEKQEGRTEGGGRKQSY